MAATIPVRVGIAPEVESWVGTLGIQESFDTILAETARIFPDLTSLQVTLCPTGDASEAEYWIVLTCMGRGSELERKPEILRWLTWRAENMSMEVGQHFMLNWGRSNRT